MSGRSSVRGCDNCEGGSVIVVRVCEWAGPVSLARQTPTMRGGTSSDIFHLLTETNRATVYQHAAVLYRNIFT